MVHGASVGEWSFSTTPPTAPGGVLRQEGGAKPEDEKKEAAKAASKAALETDPGKRLKAQVLADPTVQKLQAAVTTTPGLVVTGLIAGGGVVALGAAGKALPFQPPAIPLDSIKPGLSAKVTYQGPVNAPTQVGLTLTFEPKGRQRQEEAGPGRCGHRPAPRPAGDAQTGGEKAAEKQAEDEFVQAWVARRGLTIPLTPDAPKKPEDPRKEEQAPVQPAPADVRRGDAWPRERRGCAGDPRAPARAPRAAPDGGALRP